MSLFVFQCPCGTSVRKLRSIGRLIDEGAPKAPKCPKCGSDTRRAAEGVSMQAVETLDNGTMPRAMTRLVDAERLSRERTEAHDKRMRGE